MNVHYISTQQNIQQFPAKKRLRSARHWTVFSAGEEDVYFASDSATKDGGAALS